MSPVPGVIGAYGRSGGSSPTLGMRAWYDASKETAYANNDPVTTWQNWSTEGSSFNLGASLTLRPTYKTGVLNGLPGLDFDGSNDELQVGVQMFPTGYQHTVFVVMADITGIRTAPQTNFIFDTPTSGALSRRGGQLFITGGQSVSSFFRDGSGGGQNLNVTTGEDLLYAAKEDGAASFFRLNADGARQATFTMSTNTTASTAGFFVGRSSLSATDFFAGKMCKMIIYPTALGSSDFNATESYLKTKYGFP